MACDDACLRELDDTKEDESKVQAFEMSGLNRIAYYSIVDCKEDKRMGTR